MGRVIELVASAEVIDNSVGVIVMPTLVSRKSFLGGLQGVENGLVVEDEVGPPVEIAGPGAGGLATSAAILMDLATIRLETLAGTEGEVDSIRHITTPTALRFRPVFVSASAEIEPAVLSEKLRVLAQTGLSVEQIGNDPSSTWIENGEILSYDAIACATADFATIARARDALASLPCVGQRPVYLLRVLGQSALAYEA
jgi:homoserine dehydrogenase